MDKYNPYVQYLIDCCLDEEADELLVKETAIAMRLKLSKCRRKGRSGWQGSDCSDELLFKELNRHLKKGDMIDVVNFAAMIYVRNLIYGESNDQD